jgi:VanZ family protein
MRLGKSRPPTEAYGSVTSINPPPPAHDAPRLDPARAFCLASLLVVTLGSVAPFSPSLSGGLLGERVGSAFDLPSNDLYAWRDLILHVMLFMPLGLCRPAWRPHADRRQTFSMTLLITGALAIVIETYQVFQPSRHPQITDLLAHVLGGMLGAECAWRLRDRFDRLRTLYIRHELRIGRLGLAATTTFLFTLIVVPTSCCMSLDSWDRRARLIIGNSLDDARPWRGDVRDVAIFDRALTDDEIAHRIASDMTASIPGLLVAYSFTGKPRNTVPGTGPAGPLSLVLEDPQACTWLPADGGLRLQQPTRMATRQPATALTEAVQATNALTIEMRCRTADLAQGGPARIITLTGGGMTRNLYIGQRFGGIAVRVRNRLTGPDALTPFLFVPDVLRSDRMQYLAFTYAQGRCRLYVDDASARYDLDHDAPATLLAMGETPVAHLAAAVLCMLPFVMTGRIVFGRRENTGTTLRVLGSACGVVLAGWTTNYVATGMTPNFATGGWWLIAALLLNARPNVKLTIFSSAVSKPGVRRALVILAACFVVVGAYLLGHALTHRGEARCVFCSRLATHKVGPPTQTITIETPRGQGTLTSTYWLCDRCEPRTEYVERLPEHAGALTAPHSVGAFLGCMMLFTACLIGYGLRISRAAPHSFRNEPPT